MFIPIMHALGFEDARQWCLARGIRADLARLVSLSFQGGSSNCLEIPLPREATRSMALAYILLMTLVPDDDESKFEGVLVWIRQWGIWSETTERVGMRSEEHTSELQSRLHLVCRLLLEKKKKTITDNAVLE